MSETAIDRLIRLMAALRTPGTGCPWDLEQSFATIAPYTLEEAYEVADAIERGDLDDLKEELGDLLLQVVFHARMAEERGLFAFDDVARTIGDKLVRRHPHVFGDRRDLDPEGVKALWGEIKAAEAEAKRKAGRAPAPKGALDGVPAALPALARADKLTRKAATVGFDWPDAVQVVAKIREELGEVEEALEAAAPEAIKDEVGDLLFAVANLARHCGVDAETALRSTNLKFERRFAFMEASLGREGRTVTDAELDELEELWQQAKGVERG